LPALDENLVEPDSWRTAFHLRKYTGTFPVILNPHAEKLLLGPGSRVASCHRAPMEWDGLRARAAEGGRPDALGTLRST
jgi:hypothetical protein